MQDQIVLWVMAAASVANLIYTVIVTRSKATAAKVGALDRSIAALDSRTDKTEDRLTKIEANIAFLPDKELTHRLEISVLELKGEIGVMSERIKPVAAISQRMQDFMMERERMA